jgi:hypothetical protein
LRRAENEGGKVPDKILERTVIAEPARQDEASLQERDGGFGAPARNRRTCARIARDAGESADQRFECGSDRIGERAFGAVRRGEKIEKTRLAPAIVKFAEARGDEAKAVVRWRLRSERRDDVFPDSVERRGEDLLRHLLLAAGEAVIKARLFKPRRFREARHRRAFISRLAECAGERGDQRRVVDMLRSRHGGVLSCL